jgi:hypothetical protein
MVAVKRRRCPRGSKRRTIKTFCANKYSGKRVNMYAAAIRKEKLKHRKRAHKESALRRRRNLKRRARGNKAIIG